MIRLSRRAWNNVIIFSVAGMILLFNSASWLQHPPKEQAAPRPLVLPGQRVLSIDFGHTTLERIGQGWRLTPPAGGHVAADEWARRWYQAELAPFTATATQDEYVVQLWLAGEERPVMVGLTPLGQDVLVRLNRDSYVLKGASIHYLVPER